MKAAIAGGTGFIGTHLISFIEKDDSYENVIVLARKKIELAEKFEVKIGAFSDQALYEIDVAFCALGTTMAAAGSKDAFYHVDHDLVLEFAQKVKFAGAKKFVLVSSVGADAKSSNYYLKVKGQTEEDLKILEFESLIILRPSMLLGERKEFRFGELIGKAAMTVFNPLLIGPTSKYRGIQGKTVARCMHKLAKENLLGVHVLEYKELQAF